MTTPRYRDKDDLGRPRPPPLHNEPNWQSSIRFRRKRRTIFVFLSICTIIYLLLHSRWWSDVLFLADGPQMDRTADPTNPNDPSFSAAPASHNSVPVDSSFQSKDPKISKFTYKGPIRFIGLYETLSRLQQLNYRLRNRHVVFIAANMNTASILAGIACEMSLTKRNVVHLALVGRNELSIEFFKKANGMAGDACGVIIHDARPDYASVSTDERMALALRSSIKYMKDYFTPTVLISDTDREDAWFRAAITAKAKDLHISHVNLPHDAATVPWFQKLDAQSLSSWYKPTIDIVIHADRHSGQLVRLLKSLRNADYFTATLPRLFIDLDPDTDKSIRDFVNSYTWPSKDRLFVRHRIISRSSSKEDPVAFVESYFPNSDDSAVLYLSPNIELSPFYFHFLYYSILDYRYSNTQPGFDINLVYGISLDAPLSHSDGSPFDASEITAQPESSKPSSKDSEDPPSLTPYFYAAPSTHATLFFGTHWRLLHLYLAKRLDRGYSQDVDYSTSSKFSKTKPTWAGYFSELLTAGGYVMLYPNFDPSESLVVYHTEKKSPVSATKAEKGIMRDNNVLNYLPGGKMPIWTDMPILGMDGRKSSITDLMKDAKAYKEKILKKCGGVKKNDGEEDSVDDLFCDRDEVVKERRKRKKQETEQIAKVEEQEVERDGENREGLEKEGPEPEEPENGDLGSNKPRIAERVKEQKAKDDSKARVKPEIAASVQNSLGKERDDQDLPAPMKLEIETGDLPELKTNGKAKENTKPKVIHDKIVSLDDLEELPVKINGKTFTVDPNKAVPKNNKQPPVAEEE
ncbi:hypothetical protein ABW20_dc0110416 [Dactylellina cionopaga]|nr:hypothetical protein ABW20_dc0110416 [Dactylellina cionopaga]